MFVWDAITLLLYDTRASTTYRGQAATLTRRCGVLRARATRFGRAHRADKRTLHGRTIM